LREKPKRNLPIFFPQKRFNCVSPIEFHRLICEWSGSAALLRARSALSSQIQRFVVQSHPWHYPDLIEVGTRHQPIAAARRSHDADQAAQGLKEPIMLIWSEINP
jgi:DNA-binding GntR family transcriptional regulator